MSRNTLFIACILITALAPSARPDELATTSRRPLFQTVDLDPGETAQALGARGKVVVVRLIEVNVTTDPLRAAVRSSRVRIEIDGQDVTLGSGNYELPRTVGAIQVDCPVVSAYRKRTTEDHWRLEKAARLRFWPAGSPWIEPDTFVCPVRQRWFAGLTQMSNEPTYVDAGEVPGNGKIYYHAGSTSAAQRDLSKSSPRPTDWSCRVAPPSCRPTIPPVRRSGRATMSCTCATIAAGITATATCRRSTRPSSRARP